MMISALTAPAGMLIFSYTMIYAAVTDLTTMTIRNRLVLVLLAAYVVLAPLAGFTPHEIGLSAAIAAGTLLVGFLFFARGWIGGGDAKLAAVTVLWFGADHTPAYLVYTALFGGAFTLLILWFRIRVLPAWLQSSPWIARLHAYGSDVTLIRFLVSSLRARTSTVA
jgi:prepilin peptidase CpaA